MLKVEHGNQDLAFYGILHSAAATASVDGECMNIHTQEREHNVFVHPVCTSKVRLCVEEAGLQARLPESAGFSNCLISARGAQNTPVTRPKRDFGRKSVAEGSVSPCILPSPRRTSQSETIWFSHLTAEGLLSQVLLPCSSLFLSQQALIPCKRGRGI